MFVKEKTGLSSVIYKIDLGLLGPVKIKYDDNISLLEIEGKICESNKLKKHKGRFDRSHELSIKMKDLSGPIAEAKELLGLIKTLYPELEPAISDLEANYLKSSESKEVKTSAIMPDLSTSTSKAISPKPPEKPPVEEGPFTKEKSGSFGDDAIYKIDLGPLGPVTIKYHDFPQALLIEGKICKDGKIDVTVRGSSSKPIKEEVKDFLRQMKTSHPKLKAAVDDLYANHLYLSSGPSISLHTLSTEDGEIKCAFASGEGLRQTDKALEIQSLDCAVQWIGVTTTYEYAIVDWNYGEGEKTGKEEKEFLFCFKDADVASGIVARLEKPTTFSQDGCIIRIKQLAGATEILGIMAESPDIFPRKILELFREKTGISIALPPVIEDAKLSPWVDLVTKEVVPDETERER